MTDFYYYDPINALNPAYYENPLVNPINSLFNFDLGMNKPYQTPKEFYEMEYTDNILDELLERPEFFKKINSSNADTIMTNNNDYSILIPDQDKFTIGDKSNDINDYLKKKKFYDIFTDLFNLELLEEDQNKIHKFQYLIINSFQKALKSYRNRYKINENDLFFHYKGGTTMKIIFEKYKKEYLNINLPDINSYFKRSDSDYQVNMNYKLPFFNFHFYNVNIITYNLLSRLKDYFNKNYKEFFNMEILTKTKMIDLMNNANLKLAENQDTDPNNIYNKINRFIGVQILDRFYYNINGVENFIINNNNENTVTSNFKINYDDFSKLNERITGTSFARKVKPFNDNNNNIFDITRNDFYITKENSGINSYNLFYNKINEDTNYVFHYMNETNKFTPNELTDVYNIFNLHRLKISCALLFETTDNKLGLLLTPSELVDISFPKIDDYKLKLFSPEKYMKYYFDTEIGELTFTGYSLEGFCYDLILIIYIETSFKPWIDKKYLKRLYRLLLLSIYVIYSLSLDNRLNLLENLRDILTKQTQLIPELENNKYFITLHKNAQPVLLNPDSPDKRNYIDSINNFFDIVISNIPTTKLVQDGKVEYLQKYLKYKKKYMLLKKLKNK